MNMNSGIKAAPVSAVVADHQLTEALQKYARVQREVGNEAGVSWALATIRSIDLNADQKARTKALTADIDIRNALNAYRATAEQQGRSQHVSVVDGTLHNLEHNSFSAVYDAIHSLEHTFGTHALTGVVADTKKK